jgi:hypothetical protein
MMDKSILAAEARRIMENDAAKHALSLMRTAALEHIIMTDAYDADEIRKHQATVKVIDQFFGLLNSFIREDAPRKPAGIV